MLNSLNPCTVVPKIFPNLNVVAHLVVPAGLGFLPAMACYFFIFVFVVFSAECFPSGGPYKSCANLYPKHHTNAQSSPPPYSLTVNTTDYEPGDIITGMLCSLI